MSRFFDLQHDLNQLAEQYLDDAEECCDLSAIDLDQRAARKLWIGSDHIACRKGDDRTLQYCGGFEYVEKDCRMECGEYVFYSVDDNRVRNHHERFTPESHL